MREKNWTKGDWYVVQYSDGWYTQPGIETDEETIVVWGSDDDREGVLGATSQEAHANARLIAAAPKLVEALEEFRYWVGEQTWRRSGSRLSNVTKKVDEALAQAYGEKPE